MRRSVRALFGGCAAAAAFTAVASAQVTQAASTSPGTPAGPQIGQTAPDFSLPGSARYGLLKNPVRLSDFRGSTVVLAFFYQARTKG
jgi:hypothetical protein